jgi:hypothetical protein
MARSRKYAAVLKSVVESDGLVISTQITNATGLHRNTVTAYLSELYKAGEIDRVAVTGRMRERFPRVTWAYCALGRTTMHTFRPDDCRFADEDVYAAALKRGRELHPGPELFTAEHRAGFRREHDERLRWTATHGYVVVRRT